MTTEVSPITTDLAWIKNHVIALVLAAALAAGSVWGVLSIVDSHDAKNAAIADARLAAATAQTTAAQNQLAQEQTQLLALIQQLQAQNLKLSQSISARNTQTATQVKTDASLSAQEAAVRLATQTQAQPGQIVVSGNNLVLDLPLTRSIVSDLDLLVTAQANYADSQTQLNNETQLFNKSQDENAQSTKVIEDLTGQNKEQVLVCKAQIEVLKAQNRKSKIKTFFVGFGLGFVAGVTAHLW